jgi:hypothetical protein
LEEVRAQRAQIACRVFNLQAQVVRAIGQHAGAGVAPGAGAGMGGPPCRSLIQIEADMENKGVDDATIEQTMSITRKVMQPIPMGLIMVVSSFIFTVILASIMGFFLKKEQGIFDQFDQD